MWTCKNRENMSKNHIFICNMHGNNVVKYAELNTNQQACGACVCTGLGSPRDCRCCDTKERSIGIEHSGNPSCVERGDVEQVCSNLEINSLCLRLLTLSLCLLFISCMLLLVFIFTCLIYCVLNCYTLGDCLLTFVFNQESQRGTSTLI